MGNHFDQIADVYDNVWHFSDSYKSWMLDNIVDLLNFDKNDIFVDIGGGTAEYTKLIANSLKLNKTPYCVEPSVEMSNVAKKNSNLNIFNEDGNTFAERPLKYDKVLLKEVIHHIKDRKSLWKNLYTKINKNGRILIVTRPQKIKMPLFGAAKDAFYENQPPYETFTDELKRASFSVDVKIDSYCFFLDKAIWFNMLRKRFMSDLGKFTDEEIENGIKEIENSVINSNQIKIEDEVIFIVASK